MEKRLTKAVYHQLFSAGQSLVEVNAIAMPQGLLLYQCRLSDGTTRHGKIIHASQK